MVGSNWERFCMDNPVKHKYVFRSDVPFDLPRIYPTKQEEICKVYDILKSFGVEKAYVFGSATNMKCTFWSDTDLAIGCEVDWEMRSQLLHELNKVCINGCDIVWLENVKRFTDLNGSIARGVKLI